MLTPFEDFPDEDPRAYDPWEGPEPTPRAMYEGTGIGALYHGGITPRVAAQLAGWTVAPHPDERNPE